MPDTKLYISVDTLVEKLKEIQSYHRPDGNERDTGVYDTCALIGAFALKVGIDMVTRSEYNKVLSTLAAHGISIGDAI